MKTYIPLVREKIEKYGYNNSNVQNGYSNSI